MSQQQVKKVALVTGGSSGIGEATALELAKLGHQVAITGLEQADLDRVLELLVAASGSSSSSSSTTDAEDNFLAFKANFEDPAQVEGLVEATVAKFGRLDILVNNAGYAGKQLRIKHQDFYEDYKNVMQVNLSAPTRLAQLAAPHLLKTKGVIINISSVVGFCPMPAVSYSVSKAGIAMLTECLASHFDGTGVRVVAIGPGPVKSNFFFPNPGGQEMDFELFKNFTLVGRIGQPIDIANTIVFLASDKASFINGTTILVDGGFIAKFGGAFSEPASQ